MTSNIARSGFNVAQIGFAAIRHRRAHANERELSVNQGVLRRDGKRQPMAMNVFFD